MNSTKVTNKIHKTKSDKILAKKLNLKIWGISNCRKKPLTLGNREHYPVLLTLIYIT